MKAVTKKFVTIRCYEELNDFLPKSRRHIAFTHSLSGAPSVKELIESQGVPHTQIDLIIVNGQSVDFSYVVQDGDNISVYPVFEGIDITPIIRLRPKPLREMRFVLDVHLEKLARLLRMVGFDALCDMSLDDPDLIEIACKKKRILLTRDKGILKNSRVMHGYFVREKDPRKQLLEIMRRFDLKSLVHPLTRCLECNGTIHAINKTNTKDKVPLKIFLDTDAFFMCADCQRIYWHGSHYDRMQELIASIMAEL